MDKMTEIREKCKEIKRLKGYTNQWIVEQTGVSSATVNRFFSNSDRGFQYATVQPIISLLVGVDGREMQSDDVLCADDRIQLLMDIIAEKSDEIAALSVKVEERDAKINRMCRVIGVFVGIALFFLLTTAWFIVDGLHPEWGFIRHNVAGIFTAFSR